MNNRTVPWGASQKDGQKDIRILEIRTLNSKNFYENLWISECYSSRNFKKNSNFWVSLRRTLNINKTIDYHQMRNWQYHEVRLEKMVKKTYGSLKLDRWESWKHDQSWQTLPPSVNVDVSVTSAT